jgi:hypothetical protein
MAKNDKKSAAKEAFKKENDAKQQKIDVIQTGDLMNHFAQEGTTKSTLSPDATVMALNGLKTMVHDNPNAAAYYGMSDDAVKQLNQFTLAGFATILAIEVETNKSQFAQRMLEKQPEAINAISEFTGVRINLKALPAPDKDGMVTVPSTAIEVSEEAKKKIKEENKKIEKSTPTTNPVEIKDEDQLKASLIHILAKSSENPDGKIHTVTNFYRGYLTIQANRAENKEEALQKVKNMSRSELLNEIATLVGPCPFALEGIGKMFRNLMVKSGSVITPFCLYRRTAKNTDKDPVDDAFVADVVKTLITWSCNSVIAQATNSIADSERMIKKNQKIIDESKDENEVTIAKTALRYGESQKDRSLAIIEEMKATLETMNTMSLNEVDNLISNYNAEDTESEAYKQAHQIVDNIIKTYYKGIDLEKVDKDQLLNNVQQRAGIIINLFRDPLSRSIAYTEANLTEMKEKAEEAPKK